MNPVLAASLTDRPRFPACNRKECKKRNCWTILNLTVLQFTERLSYLNKEKCRQHAQIVVNIMDDDPATQQNVTIEEIDGKKRFLYAQYQRSPHYRVIYCDGALGTVTNNGSLHCAIFSDHPTIPTKVYQEVEEDGNKNLNIIGTPEPADNDSLLTRELESMLVMNIETAKSLYGWLGRRINEYDQKLKNENDNNQA